MEEKYYIITILRLVKDIMVGFSFVYHIWYAILRGCLVTDYKLFSDVS